METTNQPRGMMARFDENPTYVGEERKMSDFNLGNDQGGQEGIDGVVGGAAVVNPTVPQVGAPAAANPQAYSGGAPAVTLDKKVVSDDQLKEKATRQSRLEQLRREQREELKKAERAEREHFGGGDSISDLWDEAIKDVVSVYNDGEEITGIKKAFYDFVGKVTLGAVDMYSREANAMLSDARYKAKKMKKKLDYINKRLNKPSGRNKGIAVILREEEGLAALHANSLVKTKQSIEEYNVEIAKVEGEIAVIDQDVKDDQENDYNEDKELKLVDLKKMRTEYQGLEKDKNDLATKLARDNVRVKSKKAIVTAIEMVYSKGMTAYNNLDSQIQIAQEYLNEGRFIDEGLLKTVSDVDEAVGATIDLRKTEDILGRTVARATKKIAERMNEVEVLNQEKPYLDEMEIEANADEQKLNDMTDRLIKEYATVAVK
ncbi:hypothetical protein KY343_01470 [Candidatus Woesearchaeota archaeon]|nr:hypothetical protein [Candidatus Woesearchaeota archaeon]